MVRVCRDGSTGYVPRNCVEICSLPAPSEPLPPRSVMEWLQWRRAVHHTCTSGVYPRHAPPFGQLGTTELHMRNVHCRWRDVSLLVCRCSFLFLLCLKFYRTQVLSVVTLKHAMRSPLHPHGISSSIRVTCLMCCHRINARCPALVCRKDMKQADKTATSQQLSLMEPLEIMNTTHSMPQASSDMMTAFKWTSRSYDPSTNPTL